MFQQQVNWNALQIYAQAHGEGSQFSSIAPTLVIETPNFPTTQPDQFRVAKLFANFGNQGSTFSSIAPTLIVGSEPRQPLQPPQADQFAVAKIFAKLGNAGSPFSYHSPPDIIPGSVFRLPEVDQFAVAKVFAGLGNSGSQFSSIAPTLIIGSQPLQPQQQDQFAVAKLFGRLVVSTAQPVVIPIPPPPPIVTPTGGLSSKAIVFALDRQVFEPIQAFPEIIRSVSQEAASAGATWADLTNPWSTYSVAWNTFPNTNDIAVFFGTDGTGEVLWSALTNSWSTYNQAWNSFPAGGGVHVFSANASNDNGVPIPYSFTPVFFVGTPSDVILLDSWEFYLQQSQNFELATIVFEAQISPLTARTLITATFVDLSDPTTFAIPKSLPTLNAYSRFIRMTISGDSFYRAFAFGGGTVWLQIQNRPSR